jgi:hypothetical protein
MPDRVPGEPDHEADQADDAERRDGVPGRPADDGSRHPTVTTHPIPPAALQRKDRRHGTGRNKPDSRPSR